jgi:hypothetical protein
MLFDYAAQKPTASGTTKPTASGITKPTASGITKINRLRHHKSQTRLGQKSGSSQGDG